MHNCVMHILDVRITVVYDNCFRRLVKSFQPKEKSEKKKEKAEWVTVNYL